ncbi:MAG: hypothetical protein HY996_00855 [Micrococcales bacterium]|nr:hypothetical protein [Micrococcales bacterium]
MAASALLVTAGAGPASAADVTSTAPTSPSAPYVLVLWQGGPGQQWPSGGQRLVTSVATASTDVRQLDAQATACGITYQADLYVNDQTTQSLIAGGKLLGPSNPAESWPGGQYRASYSNVFTTPGCSTPTVKAEASACIYGANPGTVTATFGAQDAGVTYSAVLNNLTRKTSSAPVNVTGKTTYSFANQPLGNEYSVTVTAKNGKTATSTTVMLQGCGKVGGVSIVVQPCTSSGGQAGLLVTSVTPDPGTGSFQAGHSYQLRRGGAGGTPVGPAWTASPADYTQHLFPVGVQNIGAALVLVDVTAAPVVVQDLGPVDLGTCPAQPATPTISATSCVVGDTTRTVEYAITGLVPGRQYDVAVNGGTPVLITAGSDGSYRQAASGFRPGPFTVSVTDLLQPSYTASATSTLGTCATRPTTAVTVGQCSAPGGLGSLEVTLSDTVAARSYLVSVQDGATVIATAVVTAAGPTAQVPAFTALTAAKSYTVTAVDTEDPRAAAVAVTSLLGACPTAPTLSALITSCSAQTSSSIIQGSTSGLAAGQVWAVQLQVNDPATATWSTIVDRPGLSTVTPADLLFSGVASGAKYRISLASQTSPALFALAPVSAPRCQVSGVEFTAEDSGDPVGPVAAVSSLARTGADAAAPAVGALGLLLLGVTLTVIATIRRRKGAES